jgi:hypothetical protein
MGGDHRLNQTGRDRRGPGAQKTLQPNLRLLGLGVRLDQFVPIAFSVLFGSLFAQ